MEALPWLRVMSGAGKGTKWEKCGMVETLGNFVTPWETLVLAICLDLLGTCTIYQVHFT